MDFFQLLMDAGTQPATSGSESDSSEKSFLQDKTLSKDELFGQIAVFLLAGYETTMTALCYTATLLAMHQDAQDECAKEIAQVCGTGRITYDHIAKLELLDATLKESMRLYSPVRRFFRECVKDTIVEGIDFRKGDIIMIPGHVIHVTTFPTLSYFL